LFTLEPHAAAPPGIPASAATSAIDLNFNMLNDIRLSVDKVADAIR